MVIKEKLGPLSSFRDSGLEVDFLPLEWYECDKRILHKKTSGGIDVHLRFLKQSPALVQDDVLYADDRSLIAVELLHCEAMVLQPQSMHQMALVCYEIGNKHLPLFYEGGELLMPYDAPVCRLLQAAGLEVSKQKRKLTGQLRTSVSPHAHAGGEGLLSKILRLTTTADE